MGLLLREGQSARGQPRGEHADDRLGVLPGLTEHDEVVGIADDGAVPLDTAGARALDAEGGLDAVEGDVGEEGADDRALPGAGVGGMEDAVVQVACFEPLLDEGPPREGADGRQQVRVADVVERPLDVGVDDPVFRPLELASRYTLAMASWQPRPGRNP